MPGRERDVGLRRHALRPAADGHHRLVEQRALRHLEAESVAQHTQRPLVLGVVAEHGLDRHARRQRHAPAAVDDRFGMLDHEPHDRLGVAVDHGQRLHGAAHPHRGEQRALLEHAGEALAHRAGGQLFHEIARRAVDLRPPHRGAGLVQRQRRSAGAAGRSLGAQARLAQAAVEAVEQDAVGQALPAALGGRAARGAARGPRRGLPRGAAGGRAGRRPRVVVFQPDARHLASRRRDRAQVPRRRPPPGSDAGGERIEQGYLSSATTASRCGSAVGRATGR